MKKILSIFICICILAFSLVACCGSGTAEVENESINRLQVFDKFYIDDPYVMSDERLAYTLVDRETGVCYLYISGDRKVAITVMLDADGKPLIWEGKS